MPTFAEVHPLVFATNTFEYIVLAPLIIPPTPVPVVIVLVVILLTVILAVVAEIFPANVGFVLRTTLPVPVELVTPVPPRATGRVPEVIAAVSITIAVLVTALTLP